MSLPPNLLDEAKSLSSILRKTREGKRLTIAEQSVVGRYQEIYDEETSRTYVSSQEKLANALGVVRETISRAMKKSGSPGREKKGYCVDKWQEFLKPDMESLADYDVKVGSDDANSAEIHQLMLVKARELHAKLELAEKRGEKGAIDIFEKRWLNVAKAAKDYENLIQKHDLEVGETVRVSDMEEVETIIIISLLDASNRFLDEFAIEAEKCEGAREIRAKSEGLFEKAVKSSFKRAVKGKHVDPRVLTIWEKAMRVAPTKVKKAPAKKAAKKKGARRK